MGTGQGNTDSLYPIPLDNNQSTKVLFPDGVTTLAEDYSELENIREFEDLVRFNSIVKSPGIVSLKASELINSSPYEGRKLFPYVDNNSLIIRYGVGFTRNGAMIVVPYNMVIPSIDYTLITNYTTDTTTNKVYLVLRKKTYDSFKRSHPITGAQQDTRRYVVGDKSCVEFLVIPNSENFTGNPYDYDNDVVILGRITNISSPAITFDYTRLTGYRQLLQVTENPTCDVGGFTMDGHIDMQSLWEILNLPLLGSASWLRNGSVNNYDFTKLFTLTNYKLGVLRDIMFEDKGSDTYAITFKATNNLAKLKIFPAIAPPKSIEYKISGATNYSVNIPANYVCYLKLSDTASGFNQGNNLGTPQIENDELIVSTTGGNYTLEVADYSTVSTYNNADRLRIYPICWHYNSGVDRRLIFANGLFLNVGEEINSYGKYSGYVDTAGDTMSDDLTIKKDNARYWLQRTTADDGADIFPGLFWKNADGRQTSQFYRKDIQDGTVTNYGDHVLTVYNPTTEAYYDFIFKNDGRLQVFSEPQGDDDVIRQIDMRSKVSKTGDNMIGDLVFINGSQPVVLDNNPSMVLQDTTGSSTYQAYVMKNEGGTIIGRVIRFSDNKTSGYGDMNDGDMLFEVWSSDGVSKASFTLRQDSSSLNNCGEFYNLRVTNDIIVQNQIQANTVATTEVGLIQPLGGALLLTQILSNIKSKSFFFSN